MLSIALPSIALVLAATGAQAQFSGLTGSLSSSCQSAAANLLGSDFASCANVLGLVSVISASGSVITPLNSYISGICTSQPCSQSTLNSAKSTLSSGCQTDINNEVPAAVALNTIITDYPDVRNLLCLQSTSNSSYCVTDTLTNIQSANGTDITVDTVEQILGGGFNNLVRSLNSIPSGAYCTDCGHAIFTEAGKIGANATASSSGTSSASSAISSKCGASFVDGQIPSSVSVAGSSSSSSGAAPSSSASNSAASSSPLSSSMNVLFGALMTVVAFGAGAAVVAV